MRVVPGTPMGYRRSSSPCGIGHMFILRLYFYPCRTWDSYGVEEVLQSLWDQPHVYPKATLLSESYLGLLWGRGGPPVPVGSATCVS